MMKMMKLTALRRTFSDLLKREDGASAIEYAIIAGLIAVAIIVTAGELGGSISDTFQSIIDALTT